MCGCLFHGWIGSAKSNGESDFFLPKYVVIDAKSFTLKIDLVGLKSFGFVATESERETEI